MAKELLKDLIYGDQLVSDGCEVEFALGLTYSLDLDALLSIALTLGNIGNFDENTKSNPLLLLEGIRRCSDKFVVFCNKGSIAIPKSVNSIYSLLENSVFEVQNTDDILANFHPKIWVIKEKSREDDRLWLKLVVMSRNLTFSNSLDICCSMRGEILPNRHEEQAKKYDSLKQMISKVSCYADRKKKLIIQREILDCINRVGKFDVEEPFDDCDFFSFFYNEQSDNFLANNLRGDAVLVISPFVDITALSKIVKNKENSKLITRRESVTQKILNCFGEVWVPNDSMIDNTTASINLHAKMYLVWNAKNRNGYTLYLGSANATNTAFNRNTEFLLGLHYKRTTKDRLDELFADVVGDDRDCRFVKLESQKLKEDNQRDNRKNEEHLKKIINCIKNVNIQLQGNGKICNIKVIFKKEINNFSEFDIEIRPLQCVNEWKKVSSEVCFENIRLNQLSEFYVFKLQSGDSIIEMITKVATNGIPKDRDNLICQSIVKSEKDLLEFITLMLTDSPMSMLLEAQRRVENDSINVNTDINKPFLTLPLYEQLLRTAYEDPKQIDEIQNFVNRVKNDIVPKDLKQILETFKNALKKL